MNDQWIPGPPSKPPQWVVDPLPPSDDWNNTEGCASTAGPAIVQGITITGVPATVSSLYWQVSLNDGGTPPNFQINQLDGAGGFVSTSMQIAPDSITFNDPVLLSEDPVAPMEAVTKQYVDAHVSGIPEPPDNQTYGRAAGAWNLVVPAAGGTFTGQTNFGAGGAVTSGALLFAGNAVCSIPTVAQLTIGGGSLGQVPATDGNGNLSWITPVTGGPYLPIAGGTVTGNLTVTGIMTVSGPNSMVLNAPPGNQRAILGQSSGLTRWQLQLGDQTAEGAGNAGSNFSLSAYALTGTPIGTWLTIARADGATVFNGSGVTIQGGLAVNGLLAVNSIGNFYLPGGMSGQVLTTNGSGLLSWANQSGGISDAPNDGTLYGRKSAAWSHLTHNDITDWATAVPAPGIPDAPSDGTQYGRQSGAWTPVVGGGGGSVTVGATPPSSPSVGALWWDSVGGQLYVWYQDVNTSQWVIAVNSGGAASGGASISVGATPPASPSVGALWWDGNGGQLYVWINDGNSSQWVPTTNQMAGVVPASTTVLGGVKVDGTSIKAAVDGTISTVLVPMGDNRIINGDMRIDQRNSGNSGTAFAVTVDRWKYNGTVASKGTWQRSTGNAAAASLGFPYYLNFTSSSAYAVVAGDTFYFYQPIEADMISDFAWGTSNAQPVTLSFWLYSSLSGTFGGAIANATNARSYPFAFPVSANTWTKTIVTIPGDTGGTWGLSGNSLGASVFFNLGAGATYSGPAGAWTSADYRSAIGAVSIVGTNGASFNITGVKLEIGSVATPYNRQSLAKSQADCERYFRWLPFNMQQTAPSANSVLQVALSFSAMRAVPTVNPIQADPNTTQSNANNSVNTITPQSPYSAVVTLQSIASGACAVNGYRCSATAEL